MNRTLRIAVIRIIRVQLNVSTDAVLFLADSSPGDLLFPEGVELAKNLKVLTEMYQHKR